MMASDCLLLTGPKRLSRCTHVVITTNKHCVNRMVRRLEGNRGQGGGGGSTGGHPLDFFLLRPKCN
jgi:hypothetical protein